MAALDGTKGDRRPVAEAAERPQGRNVGYERNCPHEDREDHKDTPAVPLVEEGQRDGEEAVACYEESVQPPHVEEADRHVADGHATFIAERPFARDAAGQDLRVRNCGEGEVNGDRAHAGEHGSVAKLAVPRDGHDYQRVADHADDHQQHSDGGVQRTKPGRYICVWRLEGGLLCRVLSRTARHLCTAFDLPHIAFDFFWKYLFVLIM